MQMPKQTELTISKQSFLNTIAKLYRVCNVADHESNPNDWTKSAMAGRAGCQHLDRMIRGLVGDGVITEEEAQIFYDTL